MRHASLSHLCLSLFAAIALIFTGCSGGSTSRPGFAVDTDGQMLYTNSKNMARIDANRINKDVAEAAGLDMAVIGVVLDRLPLAEDDEFDTTIWVYNGGLVVDVYVPPGAKVSADQVSEMVIKRMRDRLNVRRSVAAGLIEVNFYTTPPPALTNLPEGATMSRATISQLADAAGGQPATPAPAPAPAPKPSQPVTTTTEPAAEPQPVPAAPAATTTEPPTVTYVPPAQPQGGRRYRIIAGDTLADIASVFYGSPQYWRHIVDANPGLDPSNLEVGTVISIPPLPKP